MFQLGMASQRSWWAVDFWTELTGMFRLNLGFLSSESFFHSLLFTWLHQKDFLKEHCYKLFLMGGLNDMFRQLVVSCLQLRICLWNRLQKAGLKMYDVLRLDWLRFNWWCADWSETLLGLRYDDRLCVRKTIRSVGE